ncbi:MAG: hypothetical protein FJ304_17735 [Planctomycetes bacterium]|nr:hypothetical protein [Planctomycetota bacterium]
MSATLGAPARTTTLKLVGLFTAAASVAKPRAVRPRATLLWFVGVTLALHLFALAALDAPWPGLRDPEHALRLTRLRARTAEHPARPVVVVVGTSRACMGVAPGAWEAARPGTAADPLLFNFSTVGAGPIQQLVTVRRLFADGARPAVVLLEYWPPVLRQDGRYDEQDRIDRRLRYDDLPVVRGYFSDPARAERLMLETRANPIYANRDRWTVRAIPTWLAPHLRADITWRGLDPWGYLPGPDVKPHDAATRQTFLDHYRADFRARFDGFAIHLNSDRALREAAAVARANGAQVGFLFLPESSEVRGWYTAEAEAAGRAHLAALARDLGAPVIDARQWVADNLLADGHHLSRVGANEFTPRLGAAVCAAFFAKERP